MAVRAASDVGGYEHTFVDKIVAKYHCNICSNVLRDARLTVCCGQHYCDSCLEQWSAAEVQNKKKTCPHCRHEGFESVLNKAMIREINEFRVKCSNHKKGCGWVGELGDLEKHMKSKNGCEYVMVKCNYSGYHKSNFSSTTKFSVLFKSRIKPEEDCTYQCERWSLPEHQRSCKYRPYECEYCGKLDTYDAIAGEGKIFLDYPPYGRYDSNHYSLCDQYPVKCPNECGEKTIKRCDIRRHRELCPLEPLSCPYKNVGCSSMIPRRDMDSHCQTNMQNHLLMMAKSHDELLRKNKELYRNNEELTKRVTALEKRKK